MERATPGPGAAFLAAFPSAEIRFTNPVMTDSPVSFSTDGDVAVLHMDDGKANALGHTMMDALDAALDRAEKEAKVVVLTGRDGRFCAGFDLKQMMAGPDAARAMVTRGADVLMRFYGHPQPVVIGCTGHAIAGGSLLVLTGDLRLCADGDFKIGLNELSIGMPLPILAHELARDRLSKRYFVEATLFAGMFSPQRAKDAGWIDRVVSADALRATAVEEAKKLVPLSGRNYALSKNSIRRGLIKHVKDTLEANMREFTVQS